MTDETVALLGKMTEAIDKLTKLDDARGEQIQDLAEKVEALSRYDTRVEEKVELLRRTLESVIAGTA